jgi:hypothetical protein
MKRKTLSDYSVYPLIAMWNETIYELRQSLRRTYNIDISVFKIPEDRINLLIQNPEWIRGLYRILVRLTSINLDELEFRFLADEYTHVIKKEFPQVFESPQRIESAINQWNEMESRQDIYGGIGVEEVPSDEDESEKEEDDMPAFDPGVIDRIADEDIDWDEEEEEEEEEPKEYKQYIIKIWLDDAHTRFIGITA